MKSLILFGVLVGSSGALAQASPQEAVPAPAAPPAEAVAPSGPSSPRLLTDAEQEAFLLEAEVVKTRRAPGGITNSTRATLRRGDVVHDAHIQIIDEYKSQMALGSGTEIDFRDSWRNNVAAYRLDRLMGLGMVPVTVIRRDDETNKMASFTWWIDDVLMTEKERFQKKISSPDTEAWNRQIFIVRAFDQLIYNFDRNLGNLVIDKDWTIWMIDHTRAFKIFKDLKSEKNLSDFCERDLLVALRSLTRPALKKALDGVISDGQIDSLLVRRDKIVKCYEQKIAARGEGRVLYDLPSRLRVATAPQ
jgi:hypothetical protein